jgi:predicted outer membrane repeat protein
LTIEGGYADCTQATPDATHTLLSGAGAHAPVLTITAPTGGLIHLRNLDIKNGSVDGAGQGGGIRFSGNGILELQNSTSPQHRRLWRWHLRDRHRHQYELVIGADVVISNNTARYDGGGVYADGLEMSMVDNGNSSILLNTAQGLSGDTGYGGGLYLTAQTLSSYAYIGSGAPGFGAINLNHARYGGGVAVGGQSQNGSSKVAQLQLFSTQAGYPGSIQNNDASVAGGAIHLRSGNSGNIAASAQLWNASCSATARRTARRSW